MGRLTQGLIAGGFVAAVAGMMVRKKRNQNTMNRYMNMMINTMGKMGVFRLLTKSRWLNRMMVRSR